MSSTKPLFRRRRYRTPGVWAFCYNLRIKEQGQNLGKLF
jgi:hypothetical protein